MEIKKCSLCESLNPLRKIITKEKTDSNYKTTIDIEVKRFKREIVDGVQYESKVPERLELCENCLDTILNDEDFNLINNQ
jgi:hypothetical protein